MQAHSTKRRTRAKGHPGVHFREVGGRRRYEITYLDSDGRRRWQMVPGLDNLDEAEALLIELRGKLQRGERVAPSRLSFAELQAEWFGRLSVAERTRDGYERNLRLYLLPRFGLKRAQELTTDDVARLIAELEAQGLAGWSIRGVLTTLSSLCSWAVRRGKMPLNPVHGLERAERPKADAREKRVLDREEIGRLLEASPEVYRPLLTTAVFSGLRLMELLGLRWCDVDGNELHVRHQLSRSGGLVPLKTKAGKRDVVLMPELTALLKRHRLAARYSQPGDPVFASRVGKPFPFRKVQRGMDAAVAQARFDPGKRQPTLHDLRHTFASLLIAQGLDVVFIARQLGHKDPATTLSVYADEFDRQRHGEAVRAALSAEFGNLLETAPGNRPQDPEVETASLSRVHG